MAKLIIIGAIGKNRELGKNNDLIWHLKGDMQFFKEQTMNHKIVMGYNTFKSLPKLLPKREHIVLTHRDLNIEGVKVFKNFTNLVSYLDTLEEDVYIIGGATVYKLFLPIAEELLLTEIDQECALADVYFPELNWEEYQSFIIKEMEEDNINYRFVRLRKKD